jgi:hypothetical protein
MQVDKILIVESPVKLWRLLRSKEEIIDQSSNDDFFQLTLFMDYTDAYVNGCKCDKEESYEAMMDQYTFIQNNDDIVSHLIKGFECDKIEFK